MIITEIEKKKEILKKLLGKKYVVEGNKFDTTECADEKGERFEVRRVHTFAFDSEDFEDVIVGELKIEDCEDCIVIYDFIDGEEYTTFMKSERVDMNKKR